MNWLDIVVIVVVVISAFIGLRTGIVRTIATFVGIGLGVYLAGQYYKGLAPALSSFITNESLARIAAFIVILLVVFLLSWFAGLVLKKILGFVLLGWLDSLLGALFGFVTGAALCGAFIIALGAFGGESFGKVVKDSVVAPIFLDKLPVLMGLLPKEFDAVLKWLQP